jgi:osmotically-inducible protein OsmY
MAEPTREVGEAPDDRIRRQVIAAMRQQPWVDTYLVFPMVRNGVVTFHGFCGTEKVTRALRVLAEGIEGVKETRFETTPTPALFLGAP